MNELVRFDPFNVVDDVLKSVLRPAVARPAQYEGSAWTGTLPIDIAENDASYFIWADLPGVRKEDVDVAINGRELTLSAELKREYGVDQGQGKQQLVRRERPYGTITRTITFPVDLDDSKANAEYRDGVLMLTLPKVESAQVKRLTIH